MKCGDLPAYLIPYLDGELDKETERKIIEHLKHCSSCRQELMAYERINKFIKRIKISQPLELHYEKLWSKIKKRIKLIEND